MFIVSPEDQVSHGYMVSITLDELSDLWGPVWTTHAKKRAEILHGIQTEGGYIRPIVFPLPTIPLRTGEIYCHWFKTGEGTAKDFLGDEAHAGDQNLPSSKEITTEAALVFPSSATLLIGVPQQDTRQRGSTLTCNNHCTTSPDEIQEQCSYFLKFPGVRKSRYRLDAFQPAITASQMIGGGGNITFKKKPASTWKSALLHYFSRPSANVVPLLRLQVGLEISYCTFNARRISLWDAVRISRLDPGNRTVGSPSTY